MKYVRFIGGLTCAQHDSLLDDGLDGTLTRLQRGQLWLHRWMCAGCRLYAAQYVAAVMSVREAFGEAVAPAPLSNAMIGRLSEGMRRSRADGGPP